MLFIRIYILTTLLILAYLNHLQVKMIPSKKTKDFCSNQFTNFEKKYYIKNEKYGKLNSRLTKAFSIPKKTHRLLFLCQQIMMFKIIQKFNVKVDMKVYTLD